MNRDTRKLVRRMKFHRLASAATRDQRRDDPPGSQVRGVERLR